MKNIVIHIKAPDQKGIVSEYTQALSLMDINIINLEQHVEPDDLLFFMRVEAVITEKNNNISSLKSKLKEIDERINSISYIYDLDYTQNMAILVTKESLPLYDILIKNQTGGIRANIKFIASNHRLLEPIAEQFKINFVYLDVASNKDQANINLRDMLIDNEIDTVILARYMQIIQDDIVDRFDGKMINIHHGFLPAFKGNHPYRKAWKRGVKIIGATAHYVTNQLDEGPIITQDVVRVNHHHSVSEMVDSGRNLERNVLVEAIKAHLEYRIILHGTRTIIFNR
tara:strand:- start:521 stop:1372 length:852 start_codon:yes stop_codon:yes gene_type:complete